VLKQSQTNNIQAIANTKKFQILFIIWCLIRWKHCNFGTIYTITEDVEKFFQLFKWKRI